MNAFCWLDDGVFVLDAAATIFRLACHTSAAPLAPAGIRLWVLVWTSPSFFCRPNSDFRMLAAAQLEERRRVRLQTSFPPSHPLTSCFLSSDLGHLFSEI
jgi:hypothetical protein